MCVLLQALIEGATQLPRLSMYEQGAGRINLLQSMKILQVGGGWELLTIALLSPTWIL
jgi:hypothetical protein